MISKTALGMRRYFLTDFEIAKYVLCAPLFNYYYIEERYFTRDLRLGVFYFIYRNKPRVY